MGGKYCYQKFEKRNHIISRVLLYVGFEARSVGINSVE